MLDENRYQQIQQMLEQVETAIQQLVSGSIKSYSIGQRSFSYLDLAELRRWRLDLLQELNALDYVCTQYVKNSDDDGSVL